MTPADQGLGRWSRALLLGAGLLLAGCGGARMPDFGATLARALGPPTEGREPPPGLDAEYPSLGSVPPRPVRPPPGQRQEVTDALAADRARAARPLGTGESRAPGRTGTEGDRAVPLGPPRAAVLPPLPAPEPTAAPAAAPLAPPPAIPTPTPSVPAAPPVIAPPASPPGATPARPPAITPSAPPATAPSAPPAAAISPAPPPPPPPALMTPGAPPPPPAPDLLAPSPRGR